MPLYLLYVAAFVAGLIFYLHRHRRSRRAAARTLQQSRAAGLHEPPSLHPVIDPARCIGSGSCAQACPEQALGVVGGKAVLVNAAACIGHGACLAGCPVEAITLVFGTEKRGIDIPHVSADFETNVPGIFIAGELGGMGLIRKAAEQGRQAMDAVKRRADGSHDVDVLIVGAGPAGLAAGLAAIEHGLRYRIVEQEASLGGAIFHYPRNKIAMTAPVRLPLIGPMRFAEVSKEVLLGFWQGVVAKTGLQVQFRERLTGIEPLDGGFDVVTDRGRHRARSVLLAMGRRGTPRKLDVPGEQASKVVYRLVDAEQYRGRRVLVVGGGDSALEAAIALAAEPGTQVTLAYRGEAFSRVKAKNRDRVEALRRDRAIEVLLGCQVLAIEAERVRLQGPAGALERGNDAVIVCAGGELPTPLLKQIGVRFETRFGTA